MQEWTSIRDQTQTSASKTGASQCKPDTVPARYWFVAGQTVASGSKPVAKVSIPLLTFPTDSPKSGGSYESVTRVVNSFYIQGSGSVNYTC